MNDQKELLRHASKFTLILCVWVAILLATFTCAFVGAAIDKAEGMAGILALVNTAGAWLVALVLLVATLAALALGVAVLVGKRGPDRLEVHHVHHYHADALPTNAQRALMIPHSQSYQTLERVRDGAEVRR